MLSAKEVPGTSFCHRNRLFSVEYGCICSILSCANMTTLYMRSCEYVCVCVLGSLSTKMFWNCFQALRFRSVFFFFAVLFFFWHFCFSASLLLFKIFNFRINTAQNAKKFETLCDGPPAPARQIFWSYGFLLWIFQCQCISILWRVVVLVVRRFVGGDNRAE